MLNWTDVHTVIGLKVERRCQSTQLSVPGVERVDGMYLDALDMKDERVVLPVRFQNLHEPIAASLQLRSRPREAGAISIDKEVPPEHGAINRPFPFLTDILEHALDERLVDTARRRRRPPRAPSATTATQNNWK
jgi:hypothetical protein